MKSIKIFLYKIKQDIKSIFVYPTVSVRDNLNVDYDAYWEKRRKDVTKAVLSDWQKQRADKIIPFIKEGSTVLDIGCGDGAVLFYLKEKLNIKPYGVDVSKYSIESLKNLGIDGKLIDINNIEEIRSLPEVDYIIGFEILEHLPNPEVLINELKDKTNKSLIFSFPNTGYYTYRARLLFGKFPLQWVTHPGEHLRFWTITDARWWLKNMGFEFFKIIPYEGISLINKILPNIFAKGIIVVIRNKHGE